MIDCCNVDIQYFHKRTNMVLSKKTREKASISVRKISGGFDVSIRIRDNLMDLFITEKPVVFDRLKSEGKLTIKVLEQLCSISIRDTTEESISDLIKVFSNLKSPVAVKNVLSEKLSFGENKENIPLDSPKKTSMLAGESPKGRLSLKANRSPEKSALPLVTAGFSKLMSPTKRLIAFGTGTPSKIADGRYALSSPHNLRKQARLKPSSPLDVRAKSAIITDNNHNNGKNVIRTEEQERIVSACLRGDNVFFTGGAGTGKSTLLIEIVEKLIAQHGKHTVFVTATTGLAACAVGGTTVHQFAGLSVANNCFNSGKCDVNAELLESVKYALQKPFIVRQWGIAKVLIIDEISMMGPELLETLNSIAQKARGNVSPMGGLQVVFTGDFLQLPPVAPLKSVTLSAYFTQESSTSGSGSASSSSFNRVPSRSQSDPVRSRPSQKPVSAPALTLFQRTDRTSTSIPTESKALTEATSGNALASLSQRPETQKARFCFQSTVWGEIIGTNTFVLTNIFRQSDAVFASLLNSVRCGELTDAIQESLQDCVGREFDSSDGILPTRIFTHRKDVDSLNTKELSALPGMVFEFKAIDSGDNNFLRNLPAREILKLKIGAQVILTKSIDPQRGLVNGTKAVVVRFTRDSKRPVIRFADGIERTILNEVFGVNSGGRVLAQRTQLPLDLAWGISVHKSQGMTVDKAILNLRNVFEFGQAYVALSRVRTLQGLSLEAPLTKEQVKAHIDVVDFYNKLRKTQTAATRAK